MWVKRTQEEIPAAKSRYKRERRHLAIVYGTFVFLVGTFFIGGLNPRAGEFRPWDDAIRVMPIMVCLSVLFGIFFCFIEGKRTMICPLCEKTKTDDGVTECSCGGRFVDLVTMKWVDESVGSVRRRVGPAGHWVDESTGSSRSHVGPAGRQGERP
jgi:hypothetical protein